MLLLTIPKLTHLWIQHDWNICVILKSIKDLLYVVDGIRLLLNIFHNNSIHFGIIPRTIYCLILIG